jgi:D-alanine-D-alanine ligase
MGPYSFALIVDPSAFATPWVRDLVESLGALGIEARALAADERLDLALRVEDFEGAIVACTGQRAAGEVQQLCELRNLPYSGPGPAACALAFDKVRSRQLLAYHNLPVPAAVALGRERGVDKRAIELLGWPCYLKPRRGSEGAGVNRVEALSEVEHALHDALEIDDELVLERAVEGAEYQAVCFGDRVLGVMELRETTLGVQMVTPPALSRARLDGLENLARRAVTALGVDHGFTRVDMLLSPRHNELLLEVEACPPLGPHSVVRRIARAAGLNWERAWTEIASPVLAKVGLRRAQPPQRLMQ